METAVTTGKTNSELCYMQAGGQIPTFPIRALHMFPFNTFILLKLSKEGGKKKMNKQESLCCPFLSLDIFV